MSMQAGSSLDLLELDWRKTVGKLSRELSDYLTTAGAKGGVIGLSGGVDSSVTASILRLATDNVLPLVLPSSSTPEQDVEDAMQVAEVLGIRDKVLTIHIDPIVEGIARATNTSDRRVLGNIKARVRMTILYSFAQQNNFLVIGTGDRSELLLGYFTKYGDGGVDILPIGGLYKTQVRRIAQLLGLPERVWKKPSSPALWEGQTAEGEMGISYETADLILYRLMDLKEDPTEVSRKTNVDITVIEKIINMVRISEHKRAMPPILKP